VATAKRWPPDVALVDLRLGGMDGIAVARALAQEVEAAAGRARGKRARAVL
jgi:CheY-like chemotaxis protein